MSQSVFFWHRHLREIGEFLKFAIEAHNFISAINDFIGDSICCNALIRISAYCGAQYGGKRAPGSADSVFSHPNLQTGSSKAPRMGHFVFGFCSPYIRLVFAIRIRHASWHYASLHVQF